MVDQIPPIHDAVRFWHQTEAATLAACIKFRRTPLPGWTLTWLRHAAPVIMTREISEVALRHAVREKVFQESQPSVLRAVELFWRFAEKHQWTGRAISAQAYKLPSGSKIKIEPVGRYYSKLTKSEWLVALQPRQEDFPNREQFSMWRSALFYRYCSGHDDAMIVDLSKNPVNQKRELQEITARKYPLMDLLELESRLEQVAACYGKATEIVPERPALKVSKTKQEGFDF